MASPAAGGAPEQLGGHQQCAALGDPPAEDREATNMDDLSELRLSLRTSEEQRSWPAAGATRMSLEDAASAGFAAGVAPPTPKASLSTTAARVILSGSDPSMAAARKSATSRIAPAVAL